MTCNQQAEPPSAAPLKGAALPLLLLLFFGSGCAALIYEIVWFQLLQLVIGSSAVSLGVLLGVFMGGMCLGSLALPRWVPQHYHPMRVYACLEAGLGICGLAALVVVPLAGRLYASLAGAGLMGLVLRGLVCGTCLLPPTLLMGATLPAIARSLKTTPAGVSWLGFFYGGNIAGAVFGCLLAGFSLLRYHDMRTATFLAAAINGTVSVLGFGLASLRPHCKAAAESDQEKDTQAPRSGLVSLTIALSGLCALSRRSRVDPPVVTDAGADRLCLLHHPGGLSGGIGRRLRREAISRGYNWLVKSAFATRFSDAQCGFKAITRRAARPLLPAVALPAHSKRALCQRPWGLTLLAGRRGQALSGYGTALSRPQAKVLTGQRLRGTAQRRAEAAELGCRLRQLRRRRRF